MKIKFIGKRHMKGKSKRTGNDYDFIALYFISKAPGVVGQCGREIAVDPDMIDYDTFDLNLTYEVELGFGNSVLDIVPVK